MFKARIDIEVKTSESKTVSDPYNFWTVRLTSTHDGKIKNIVEQDYLKANWDKAPAANQMLDDQSSYFDLIFGD